MKVIIAGLPMSELHDRQHGFVLDSQYRNEVHTLRVGRREAACKNVA